MLPQRWSIVEADEREAYYRILEQTQRGTVDVTAWLLWFLGCQQRAIERSLAVARLSTTSRETAKRDLAQLVELGLLQRRSGGGRSASYELLLDETCALDPPGLWFVNRVDR